MKTAIYVYESGWLTISDNHPEGSRPCITGKREKLEEALKLFAVPSPLVGYELEKTDLWLTAILLEDRGLASLAWHNSAEDFTAKARLFLEG